MKQIVSILIVCCVILTACSKDEETYYTEKQEYAFSILDGTFIDTRYANSAFLPLKMVFKKAYSKPEKFYKDDGIYHFTAHGECDYYNYDYGTKEYEIISTYFNVSEDAKKLVLYTPDKSSSYKSYGLSIKSEVRVDLQGTVTYPYVMEKQ